MDKCSFSGEGNTPDFFISQKTLLTFLTPKSDSHLISPYNVIPKSHI